MVAYELYCWRDPKGYELIGGATGKEKQPSENKQGIANYLLTNPRFA